MKYIFQNVDEVTVILKQTMSSKGLVIKRRMI
jgi:hypothetical protein